MSLPRIPSRTSDRRVRSLLLVLLLAGLTAGLQGQDIVYTGSWLNATFQSSGSARFTFTTSGDLIVDLDGSVFGASNPPAVTLTDAEITASGVTYTKSGDATYGNMTITANFDGSFSYSFTNVPGLGGGTVTGAGTIDTSSVSLTYDVGFANGTIDSALSSGDPTQVGDPFFFAQFGNGSASGLTFTSDTVYCSKN